MRLCEVWVKSGGIQKYQGESAANHDKNGDWQCGKWREVKGSKHTITALQ